MCIRDRVRSALKNRTEGEEVKTMSPLKSVICIIGGLAAVAIGGDLDGCEALAAGMTGVQDVAKLYQALEERGYPQSLLEDIFWNNWRRIL